MVLLSPAQLAEFEENGFCIIDAPWGGDLTAACVSAVEEAQQGSDPTAVDQLDTIGNHWKLAPVAAGSYWSYVDHSLPFLSVITHPEVVEIGQQLAGEDDVWLRNGGINELAPGRAVFWHHDGGDDTVEFMHYPFGTDETNGCLRVVPGSHRGPTVPRLAQEASKDGSVYDCKLAALRADAGITKPTLRDGPEDVAMPAQVSLPLRPDQLLVRSTRIFHGTNVNRTGTGRIMSHWGFKIFGDAVAASVPAATGRMRWEDRLTSTVLENLSPQQKQVLRIGHPFELDPVFEKEREREVGVRWGTVEELRAQLARL